MTRDRAKELIQKLERGINKSKEIFDLLTPEEWEMPLFDESDSWRTCDLVAHFIYSEEILLEIAQDIAACGVGTPEDYDLDVWNKEQSQRMKDTDIADLMTSLIVTRQKTIAWLDGLNDDLLDLEGRHPTLGTTNVEMVIYSIYAHQLMHMREVAPKFKSSSREG